ncbi:hypothetical protein HDU96_006754 [Phlyctochytrium bullatum]|nr:hypothetical protein HDU96_006754 [Phlyctochytrium bullatum]
MQLTLLLTAVLSPLVLSEPAPVPLFNSIGGLTKGLDVKWFSGSDASYLISSPALPANFAPVLADKIHTFTTVAKGTQNYQCVKKDDGTFAFSLREPDADLFVYLPGVKKSKLRRVGKHGFITPLPTAPNPWWTIKDQGCTAQIDTTVAENGRFPSPAGATNIPWLLTQRAGNTAAPTKPRRCETATTKLWLATSHVVRINTIKGVAPDASGCFASCVGKVVKVPYLTAYWYYTEAKNAGLVVDVVNESVKG